jgi:ribosomal protein S27E
VDFFFLKVESSGPVVFQTVFDEPVDSLQCYGCVTSASNRSCGYTGTEVNVRVCVYL